MKKENPSPDFVELEHKTLQFWQDEHCFEKLVEKNKNGKRFAFLDGPITANNPMGIHHAWGRTLKDMYIRYHAMHGESCQYQNGFDSQGLWVEVETEKEIGIKVKSDIVKYGVDRFTTQCMDRVRKYSGVITQQSKRLGQWMDWDNSYFTNTDLNITSIWHFLKVCHEKGWLVKSHRPMPWCPRCGTSLSDHEMSGSYAEMEHLSIYAKLPILGTEDKIVLWTTTPWTLTSNVALAVNPAIDYVRVRVKSDDKCLIVGASALGALKGDIVEVVGEPFAGQELVGKTYETCFEWLGVQNFVHTIVPWEDVDATEGTGVVHIAPGCGAEDFDLGKRLGLPTICPINDEGVIVDGYGPFSGQKTTDVVDDVVAALEKAGKLYKTKLFTHSYPKCWRCKTPVVFKLVDEWYIRTDEIRPMMIEAAKTVHWEPEFAGKRMLDWLNNMGDWNISRKRFYGLPLPFYPCKQCGHLTVVGSKEELEQLSEHGLEGVPHLHKPYIDNVRILCPHCHAPVERIPEVGDCWLDAGITPFSTKKYFSDPAYFEQNFPSDLVIEMKEQIRLWFYSLLFMSVTLTGKAPYKNVVAHSSVVNEEGGKFSKTGYMIRFDEAAEKMGADPVRYLFAAAPVAGDVRFGYNLADEARRKMLGFWNIYVFFNLYASIDNPDLAHHTLDVAHLTHSDRWLLQRTNRFIRASAAAMDAYRPAGVVKEFESFVDEVSNWYVRINRKRFWKSEDVADKMNAYDCLYRAIKAILGVMAPIIPFMTEYVYQNTVRELEPDAPLSVHMSDYPTPMSQIEEDGALEQTDAARAVIALGQRMRNEAGLKVKQPLRRLYVHTSAQKCAAIEPLLPVIRDELNLKEIAFTQDETLYRDVYFTVNFRVAGAALKSEAQKLKRVVDGMQQAEYDRLAAAIATDSVRLEPFGTLSKQMFDRHFRPKEHFVVSEEGDMTLALDTTLDDALMEEGFVRELVRQIQVLRKEADFNVEQRIVAQLTANGTARAAIDKYADVIANAILAVRLAGVDEADVEKTVSVQDEEVLVRLKKA